MGKNIKKSVLESSIKIFQVFKMDPRVKGMWEDFFIVALKWLVEMSSRPQQKRHTSRLVSVCLLNEISFIALICAGSRGKQEKKDPMNEESFLLF